MLFWDDTLKKWVPTTTSELVWDDTNKRLLIGGTTSYIELNTSGYLDVPEITEPSTPSSNRLRLYTEAIKGFSFFKFIDDTGMKRALVRDSVLVAKNVRGTTIAANRIVYATGSADNVPTIDLAKADSLSTLPAIGVTIESIADGAYGRVMQVGLLENINTNSLTEGDVLYVSESTAGVPTTTLPVTPNLIQEIGTCLVKSATVGAIQIVARSVRGDEYGTIQNTFYIGDGTTGTIALHFNSLVDGAIRWDETYMRIGDGTNDSLFAADGTVSFTGTARIDWTKLPANGATVTNYTTGSAVADLQTAADGNVYTCTEVAGGNNYLIVDFTVVTAFNWVRLLAYYDGNAVHNIVAQLEITPFDGSAWHTLDSIAHQGAATNTMEDHSFFVPSDTAYINSGVVKVRLLHSAATTASHTLVIDECSLYQ
jgi:hypothetical protein